MLYAVAEIAVFMAGATIVGFLLGRLTKRRAPKIKMGKDVDKLKAGRAAVVELESERASLRSQLAAAKERIRQLAAEPTAAETSDAADQEFAEQKSSLEHALAAAEAQADRLRATIAQRDGRIADLMSGEDSPAPDKPATPIGYSSSAGTLTDMRIFFDEDNEQ